jgi:phosphate starvation-inducible PhoH-like protein
MKLNVVINDLKDQQNIVGVKNNNIKVIEEVLELAVTLRGEEIFVDTEDETKLDLLEKLFDTLLKVSKLNYTITERDVMYIITSLEHEDCDKLLELYNKPLIVGKKFNGKNVVPKTLNQRQYVLNLFNKDIIFGVGPAGTGKTYLAVMYAVSLLKEGSVKKIILTRPAVEAGESLGYLPGDLKEKIAPYLRPLYDALYDALGYEVATELIEKEIIEIAPLAYMRGRTLEGACILLDEAQNTTTKQMKMFLTRLGFKSKMIITGDISQIDLPKGVKSGLTEAISILRGINEIGITEFSKDDVIRHLLVAKILARYESL